MDKTAIKNFSIWARNKLIADITYKAGLLGVTEEGIKDALPQSTQNAEFYDIGIKEPYAINGGEIKQRKELVAAIKRKALQLDYKDAYRNVVEEVAYTWFNRLIAIRFMEVNDYMPSHIRVLSSDSKNKLEPDLVTAPFDAELEFTQAETEKIIQMKNDNQVDALFRFLFIKQCNVLNAYLPKLFEKTSDYTELLLNVSVTDQDGIVYHLIHDINEDDFNISNIGEDGKPTGQVEIIGWMYQYYNTEPKNEAFALLKKNVKITKERIPAATQLFTPDWIVHYMVENSVGRLWIEGHENNNLKNEWKYYLDETKQEADVEEQLKVIREEYKNIKPNEIKIIDPCMGSGHILVYAFDVLIQIYESYGYNQRDAAKSIVENNIYGLDIDDRAFQLAYFTIMMKARSYNRRFLTLKIEPNLCAIQESNGLQYDDDMGDFLLSDEHRETLKYLLSTFVDSKEYGSILNVEKRDYDGFLEAWKLTAEASLENVVMMLWYNECNQIVPVLAKQAKLLSDKYDVLITNPPYMGIKQGMTAKLVDYVKENYPDSKSDLYSVFIEKAGSMIKQNRLVAMITQHSWMFLTSFSGLRNKLMAVTFVNMAHLGARAFEEIGGEVVQTTAFVYMKNSLLDYSSQYARLVEYGSQVLKEKAYLAGNDFYVSTMNNFIALPDNPIAYWLTDRMIEAFRNSDISQITKPRQGMATSDNDKFLRLWFEVDMNKVKIDAKDAEDALVSGKKWFPYNKGGTYRKWYGNNDYLINWEYDGKEVKALAMKLYKCVTRTIKNIQFYFQEGVTWSTLSSGDLSVRYCKEGYLFDTKGSTCFFDNKDYISYTLGLLNSKVAMTFLAVLAPTMDFNAGSIAKIPLIFNRDYADEIERLVQECIKLSKADWNQFEKSWDYEVNPIIRHSILSDGTEKIEKAYNLWKEELCSRKFRMKECEERLNEIFISIYSLEDELDKTVDESAISVYTSDASIDIKAFISYAVGCMFGRYSLNNYGVICTSNRIETTDYSDYQPDKDNVILITDEEYFDDDIVNRFCEFVKITFGENCLEENLDFIAKAIGNKGNTSRNVIRNYFISGFIKEHSNMYSVTGSGKRPIYWLFDSGKQNGFKALIYMHRYNADTIGNLRVDYLHRMERIYESEINRMQDTIDNSSNAREVMAATKRKEKLQKQLKECQEYDEKIGHLALSRIDIDLDDGVKINYEKVQTANDGKKYQVLAKL